MHHPSPPSSHSHIRVMKFFQLDVSILKQAWSQFSIWKGPKWAWALIAKPHTHTHTHCVTEVALKASDTWSVVFSVPWQPLTIGEENAPRKVNETGKPKLAEPLQRQLYPSKHSTPEHSVNKKKFTINFHVSFTLAPKFGWWNDLTWSLKRGKGAFMVFFKQILSCQEIEVKWVFRHFPLPHIKKKSTWNRALTANGVR